MPAVTRSADATSLVPLPTAHHPHHFRHHPRTSPRRRLHRVLVSLALRSHNNSNRNNRTFAGASRRCRPQCHYSLTPCFSTIPPPLEIRFNCPKHPSRNLGGLPSSWMLGGAHIDFTAPDLDQLWMLIHNTDPTQAKPPPPVPLQFVLGATRIKGMPLLLDKMVQLKGEAALFIDFQ